MTEFKINQIGIAEAWCLRNIGPRMFYLHNRIGGQGWQIVRQGSTVVLRIDDDKKATMAALTIGSQ
jgi:hypothetical protein